MLLSIFTRPNISDGSARAVLSKLIDQLEYDGHQYRLDRYSAGYLGAQAYPEASEICKGVDAAIVLGGDGTLLVTAQYIPPDIPVLAVNLGNLGFLTTTTTDQMIPSINRLVKRDYEVLSRTFIGCKIRRFDSDIGNFDAMNDIVIKAKDSGRTLSFKISIDRQPVAHYRADGVIIATPTGSTAYSLAAGGPIIFPTLKAMTITPVCPHTLTFRPVVVPDTVEICIVAEPSTIFVDGINVGELDSNAEVICRVSTKTLELIQPRHMPYFDVLREKLRWGS